MTFHIACINCKAPTQQAEMRGGRCPSCGDKHDQTVPVKLQFTADMLNAGMRYLRQPEQDARTVSEMVEAVLTAMPLDQKRVLLKSNAFQRA
jgi:hypothetical protein